MEPTSIWQASNCRPAARTRDSSPAISPPSISATYAVSAPVSISDGTHTKLLFADNNTLWIASSNCANGVRAATAAAELASQGYTDQAGNYNCLTMVTTGTATPPATIIPAVVQSNVSERNPGYRSLPQHQPEPVLLRQRDRPVLGADY